jgi:hypothetical protein
MVRKLGASAMVAREFQLHYITGNVAGQTKARLDVGNNQRKASCLQPQHKAAKPPRWEKKREESGKDLHDRQSRHVVALLPCSDLSSMAIDRRRRWRTLLTSFPLWLCATDSTGFALVEHVLTPVPRLCRLDNCSPFLALFSQVSPPIRILLCYGIDPIVSFSLCYGIDPIVSFPLCYGIDPIVSFPLCCDPISVLDLRYVSTIYDTFVPLDLPMYRLISLACQSSLSYNYKRPSFKIYNPNSLSWPLLNPAHAPSGSLDLRLCAPCAPFVLPLTTHWTDGSRAPTSIRTLTCATLCPTTRSCANSLWRSSRFVSLLSARISA